MNAVQMSGDELLEIIAFRLHSQEFCVRTTSIRKFAAGHR